MVMLWVSDQQLKNSRHGVTPKNPCSAVRKNWPSIGWSMANGGFWEWRRMNDTPETG
jgi:hypothetical protein